MGLSAVFHCVCIIFLLACIAEVGAGKMVFNAVKYGAIADGKTDNSEVFQNVFNRACQMEGINVVLIPHGRYMLGPTVFKGPCKGHVVFLIVGTLLAPTDIASSVNVDHWISFQYMDRLVIGGGGSLDGRGSSAWPYNSCSKRPDCKPLPPSLRLDFLTNSWITNLTLINSKGVHIDVFGCDGLKLRHVNLIAPANSPNTDGIHIGSSRNIDISNARIATGDDCVSLSPGSMYINITNVICGPGHGISVGSLGRSPNEEDVRGVKVKACTLIGTANGLRIKTWALPYASSVLGLTFENIIMEHVNNPIMIDQQYCQAGNCQKEGDSQVQIQDVKYRNIRGTSSTKMAVTLKCSRSKPCQKIVLRDINLLYNGGPATSSCFYAKGVAYGIQRPPSCL
ncbi:hypothetical protein I3843_11G193600 [Carya illinoinensis]|nr:hypothetical protein I3843_11G193600 [Carya illinoinensis]